MLISWENEAYLATKELGPDKFEIVVPSISHPRRAARHRRRQDRRQEGHPQGRRGLPRLPLLARRPGDRRQALLSPARCQGGREVQGAVLAGEAVHHRRSVRRLGEGAEDPLQGRRRSSTRSTSRRCSEEELIWTRDDDDRSKPRSATDPRRALIEASSPRPIVSTCAAASARGTLEG